MSVNINADTTNGLVLTSDTSGELKLQSAGADIATVNSSGITMAAGKVISNSGISSYTDSDALTLFNASGSAPVYACRAWVNFNGTGTVSIYNSGNVSSITDNGTGQYTANFTTAMPDVDYAVAGATNEDNGTAQRVFTERTGRTASSVGVVVGDVNGTERDHARISVIIVR